MACEPAKKYIQEEIAKGVTQFSSSNSMVQDLLRSSNLQDVEAFIVSTDLRSKLY